jgi:hypothetical protein
MSSSDIFDVGSPGLIWWTIPVIIFNFWRGKQKALEFCYGQRSESVKVFLLAHGSVLNKRSIIRLFTMGQWPRWGNSTAKASECADVRAPKVGSQTSPSEKKGRTNAINGKKHVTIQFANCVRKFWLFLIGILHLDQALTSWRGSHCIPRFLKLVRWWILCL